MLDNERLRVALFTRAWIEMTESLLLLSFGLSPSSRGRGLKYNDSVRYDYEKQRRPLHEGVD